MEIIYKRLEELTPYENNPRNNEQATDYVANSIKEFGFKVPIIIDKNGVIVAGHTRYLASKKLGLQEIPTIVADDLTDEQIKAFRLADNKVGEFSSWDFDKLSAELDDLDIDMSEFGFDLDMGDDILGIKSSDDEEDNPYTTKINIPQYEIKGEEPEINELFDETKTNELIEKIKNSNVSEEQKRFLIKAAQRHLAFSYNKIAEYYAHQDKEMQELMEDSALVIIDYGDAIKNGYAEYIKGTESLIDDIESDVDIDER